MCEVCQQCSVHSMQCAQQLCVVLDKDLAEHSDSGDTNKDIDDKKDAINFMSEDVARYPGG